MTTREQAYAAWELAMADARDKRASAVWEADAAYDAETAEATRIIDAAVDAAVEAGKWPDATDRLPDERSAEGWVDMTWDEFAQDNPAAERFQQQVNARPYEPDPEVQDREFTVATDPGQPTQTGRIIHNRVDASKRQPVHGRHVGHGWFWSDDMGEPDELDAEEQPFESSDWSDTWD